MKPKDTRRAIDQLITDIQENEWYCIQNGSECNLHGWEKALLVAGLESLRGSQEAIKQKLTTDAIEYLNKKMKQPFIENDGERNDI